jgi:hypothetical protein
VTQRECTQIRRTHLCGKVSEYKVKEILEGIMVNKIDHIGIAVKNLEEDLSKIHSQALKYKDNWSKRYGILPDGGGESYDGGDII